MPQIRANGVDLYYELSGPEQAPVVVFSNSLGTTLEMWDKQIPVIAQSYRCLSYDTRGHGRSEVLDQPATIEDLAADLAGLLSVLNIERAHVVGLSLGGMTAQAFACLHPERLISLTLLSTSAYLPSGYDERAALVRAKGMAVIADAVIDRWFTPAFRASHAADVASIRASFGALDPRGYAVCCGAISKMDLRPRISAITAPTLIVSGADDPATPPAMMLEIQAHIAGAEMILLPQAAHLLVIEQADTVNRYLLGFFGRRHVEQAADMRFAAGFATRSAVLGEAHVQRSFAAATPFDLPWQAFITRTAWGDIWGDPTLPRKTRSMLTLVMMVALGREEEFKLHLRPALNNGVTLPELRAVLMHAAIYAGVPATNGAFRWTKEVLGDELLSNRQ